MSRECQLTLKIASFCSDKCLKRSGQQNVPIWLGITNYLVAVDLPNINISIKVTEVWPQCNCIVWRLTQISRQINGPGTECQAHAEKCVVTVGQQVLGLAWVDSSHSDQQVSSCAQCQLYLEDTRTQSLPPNCHKLLTTYRKHSLQTDDSFNWPAHQQTTLCNMYGFSTVFHTTQSIHLSCHCAKVTVEKC